MTEPVTEPCWACSLPPMFTGVATVHLCASCRAYVSAPVIATISPAQSAINAARAEREPHHKSPPLNSAAQQTRR